MADAMKLLPCPMCGGEAALLDYEARYGGLHYASRCPQCASCGCSMGYLPTAKKAVEAWNCRASMPAPEKTPSFDDARRKLIHCIEQWDGETEYDAEDIAALADDILDVFASPPAREEAPAEGAGEDGAWMWLNGHVECDPADRDYSADEMVDAFMAGQSAALRNRTSEPEAGEAEHWRERALSAEASMLTLRRIEDAKVFCEIETSDIWSVHVRGPDETVAAKSYADAVSYCDKLNAECPDARAVPVLSPHKGNPVVLSAYDVACYEYPAAMDAPLRDAFARGALYAHPSPATADKLREVLKPFADEAEHQDRIRSYRDGDVIVVRPSLTIGQLRRAAQALATLSPKEEGGE